MTGDDSTTGGDSTTSGGSVTGGDLTTGGDASGGPEPSEARRIFVTSAAHGPDFGGLAGADAVCQQAAEALVGAPATTTFKAWLSVEGEAAADRLEHWEGPYVRTDGSQVAADWTNLVDGVIDVRINRDESGQLVEEQSLVWTGTHPDGQTFADDGNCIEWSSTDTVAIAGSADHNEASWTSFGLVPCDQRLRLYCVEQSAACGDGAVNEGEECDDGNSEDGDDCTSRCTHPSCVEDDDCPDPAAPLCDRGTQACVGCIDDGDCDAPEFCDPMTATCVSCVGGGDCPSGTCNVSDGTCACTMAGECNAPFVCDVDAGLCVECLDGTDCIDPPPDSDCCTESMLGLPGCTDATCEADVCAMDPFCCDVGWDMICVDQAQALCPGLCALVDCCIANGTPGCSDMACQVAVCGMDAYCCNVEWDMLCADLANGGVCPGVCP